MPIYSLVLTTPPQQPALSDFAVHRAWSLIPEPQRREMRWLAPSEAWEATFVTNDTEAGADLQVRVLAALKGITLDVNVVAADPQSRRKKLLIADMESTIIEQEMLDELAERVGRREEVARITEMAMRGELDFAAAVAARVALLEGLPDAVLGEAADAMTLMPGASVLVATMRAHGARTALVSGGFLVFAELIARRLGFDAVRANRLEIAGGRLTGRIVPPLLGREAKLTALQELAAAEGIETSAAIAVGDGANDLAMLGSAGLGVAFRAKPIVAQEARTVIRHGDLTALLYLQGYEKSEFAVA